MQHQSKYLRGPESASIEIPPFQTSLHKIKKKSLNLDSQCSHLEVLLLINFDYESVVKHLILCTTGGFQLMQILGL
jgi:hypothetical protein